MMLNLSFRFYNDPYALGTELWVGKQVHGRCRDGIAIWLNDNIHIKWWDMIIGVWSNFSYHLDKHPMKLWHGWVIASYRKTCLQLFIHVINFISSRGVFMMKFCDQQQKYTEFLCLCEYNSWCIPVSTDKLVCTLIMMKFAIMLLSLLCLP